MSSPSPILRPSSDSAIPAGWEYVGALFPDVPQPAPLDVFMDVQCGDCGRWHEYRLVTEQPESWEEIEGCAP